MTYPQIPAGGAVEAKPRHRKAAPTKHRLKRVEKDPSGGWIARRRDGSAIYDENWRWNSRAVARSVADEYDYYEDNPAARALPLTSKEDR